MDAAFVKVKTHIDSFNYEIDTFEKIQLFPEIVDRLIYIRSRMQEFQNICNDEHTALLVDESVRQVVKPEIIKLSVPEPGVGKAYLELTYKMIQESFIEPINKITSAAKKDKALESIAELVLYFNEVNHIFRSICSCEDRLFRYSFKNFSNIKNTKTGIVLVSPPEHIEVILVPFETALKDIVNVSSTSIQSIERWSEQVRDRKEKFINLAVNVSQVQAAEEQVKAATEQLNASKEQAKASKSQTTASMYALIFQIAVIFFTVTLLVGSYKLNLYLDKLELEKIIEQKNVQINSANINVSSLNKNILALSNELEKIRKELKEIKK